MRTNLLPYLLSTSLLAAAMPAAAQSDSLSMRTLIGSGSGHANGGWGGPTAQYTRIMDHDALLTGVRGGWIIDHRLTLGLACFGLSTDVPNAGYDRYLADQGIPVRRTSQFRMGYGGLLIEPVIAPRSAVHLTVPVIIGAGGAVYQTYGFHDHPWGAPCDGPDGHGHHDGHDDDDDLNDAQAFFVIEPGLTLELSLVKLVRVGLGVSYRYTSELDMPATAKDALHGMNASLTVKVGRF